MKKTPLIIITVFIFAVGAAGAYALSKKQDDSTVSSETTQTSSSLSAGNSTSPTPQQPATTSNAGGGYLAYDESVIAKTPGKKVLFFHAPWCSQCRSIEAGILKDGVPEGLTVIKVDYDSNQNLRKKYGVKLQTTFVKVDDAGAKTDLYVAYDEPTFDSVKRNFLN